MKKVLFTAALFLSFAISANAQRLSPNALGLRLGGSDGFGAEISYQRRVFTNNRLEFDLGWHSSRSLDAVKLAALYQWVWNIEGGFNWYAGVGGGLGSYDRSYPRYYNAPGPGYYYYNEHQRGSFAFVAGDIGIEYDFNIPLQLSLDLRPEIGGNAYYDDYFSADFGLGIRFQF